MGVQLGLSRGLRGIRQMTRKGVGHGVHFPLDVNDMSVILRKKFHPASLPTREVLLGSKVFQHLMISINKKRTTNKVCPPLLKCPNDRQQLLLMYRVV